MHTTRFWNKKSLKIAKGLIRIRKRRRTDNTMIKRKTTEGQTTDLQIRIRKSKNRQHNDQKKKDQRTNNDI